METERVAQIIHAETNFAVVQMPDRSYPGVVIQGDSLASLFQTATEALESFESDPNESRESLLSLHRQLKWRIDTLNSVMAERNT